MFMMTILIISGVSFDDDAQTIMYEKEDKFESMIGEHMLVPFYFLSFIELAKSVFVFFMGNLFASW